MWLLHLASFTGHHVCEFAHLAGGVSVSDSSFAWHLLLYDALLCDCSVLLSVSVEVNALTGVTLTEPRKRYS